MYIDMFQNLSSFYGIPKSILVGDPKHSNKYPKMLLPALSSVSPFNLGDKILCKETIRA